MRQPHARPDPRYFPPAEPEREDTLAEALRGIAAVCLFFVAFFVLLAFAQ